jgi:hypothetical protein
MMGSMDDNKHKYATDGVEEEVPLKKQKTTGDDNGDSSLSTYDYSSEPSEEVSSEEEEMNLPIGSEEELLIQWGHFDDGDTSDSENNGSIGNGWEISDDGDTSDDEEEQLSDDGSTFD